MPRAAKPTQKINEDDLIDDLQNEEDDDLLPDGEVDFKTVSGSSKPSSDDDEEDYEDAEDSALVAVDGESDVSVRARPLMFDANPNFGQDEVDIPRLRLLQGLSQEVQDGEGRPGHWVLPGHPSVDTVTFVPVGMMRNRELRNKERILQCHSFDAVQGIGDPGVLCNTCAYAQWTPKTDGSGKNNPPACSMIYVYMGVVIEHDELCIVKFQKTQMGAAKWFNQMAMTRGGFGKFAIKLESSAQQGVNGKFYVPKPSISQQSPDVFKRVRAIASPG